MIVFECTPNSFADRAQEYETLKFNYEGVEIVANYREKKADTKKATKDCFAGRVYVRDVVESFKEISSPSFDNLSKKCARHFADICEAILKQAGITYPKKEKTQAAKTWETKVSKYEEIFGDQLTAAFPPIPAEKRNALLAEMKKAALAFDQSYTALQAKKEEDQEFKALAKAFKAARKGPNGLMPFVSANRSELQRNWQDYTRVMREKGVSEKLINQIGEKAGVKDDS